MIFTQSPVTSHQSPVTSHQSPITNHLLTIAKIIFCVMIIQGSQTQSFFALPF
ncbi:hypothetical protein H5968_19820 [Sphaerospermopsis sp. LEGE 00249]|uniref:hypothetical protein n=1 Tax=Sphaerospermopsis sp. LEGE 00249 TaxID=1380707 RepID=UPI00164E03BB|nr:hypothetical protein [Sphaerospermopsis sp. LEGE 00249]MBC5797338.1 hypothetical protein [Sphaerospermopsis sp. LEGE 00249]